MTAIRAVCLVFALSLFAQSGLAEQLFGVISERNSATAAAAAKNLKESYPDAKIVLRTPRQLRSLSDADIASLLRRSDIVFVAGVFSDDADRLGRVISTSGKLDRIYVVSSTRDLISLSRGADGNSVNPVFPEGGEAVAQDRDWTNAHAYWQARGVENVSNLFAAVLHPSKMGEIAPPRPVSPVRIAPRMGSREAPLIALVDYDTGDQAGNIDLHERLCESLIAQGLACQSVFADWGGASADALEQLAEQGVAGVILLQDFAIGGSDQARSDAALDAMGVPVLKAIRLVDVEERDWRSGTDGLPTDSVYYRVALPELVGVSQPLVLAVSAAPRLDPISGIEVRVTKPIDPELNAAVRRMTAWIKLQRIEHTDKRVAIIYYNHPPGRHNIGADNLDVSASLIEILRRLEAEGYDVGTIPSSKEALLDLILERAVNMPEDGEALATLSQTGFTWPVSEYRDWFETLPERIRAELRDGPLAALQIEVADALAHQEFDHAERLVSDTMHDMAYVIEGAPVEYHSRAEDLLAQLEQSYTELINGEENWDAIEPLSRALMQQGIEGLRGWGAAPGDVMTHDGAFVFPALRFGNVLIAPQPPRGWEVNEEVLHANMSVPPTHQYLAFYRWLQTDFAPHAIVHLGRHSTYEFLPGKRVGLQEVDYPRLIAGDVPGIYPYIVDGVGEGLQAKRRGLAVIVDHLTPPLQATPFYDELLGLRQLVESFEAADPSDAGDAARTQAFSHIKAKVVELGMADALIAELEAEHGGGESFALETIAPDLLVHEVGHYLTEVQEDFMPLGLHVFGRDWSNEAVQIMLNSMEVPEARAALERSPSLEMAALLDGLSGRFVRPGKGNDPLRSPDALPTGRNFYGLDSSLIPNLVAWDIGSSMADEKPETAGNQAVVLWASDTVRDGGVMIAFGMRSMGIKPVWNGRGIVSGLERTDGPREDVSFITSGLFRDLYGEQIKWLDKAVLLALDGASLTIEAEHPELRSALNEALLPLKELRQPGRERLSENAVAASWVSDMLEDDSDAAGRGRLASARVFGPAPGRYGAGINRLAERSGSWNDRSQLSKSYIARMGHAYGENLDGQAQQDVFVDRLETISTSYLGRASNLYGLVDNDDAFDYLGGLNLAVESVRGDAAEGYVIDVSDPDSPKTSPLASAITRELHARQLNPNWIKSLMPHGYDGARTMNADFFENLWGWEATDPNLFPDEIWENAKSVYVDDRYDLGLSEFFDEQNNRPIKANILAVMLVAAHKGYWEADQETIAELAEAFASLVIEAGLPGSGHTQPDHPMLDWLGDHLTEDVRDQLQDVRAATRRSAPAEAAPPELIRELQQSPSSPTPKKIHSILIAGVVLLLIGIGIVLGRRSRI